MKSNPIFFPAIAFCALCTLASCGEENESPARDGKETALSFIPTVTGMGEQENLTRTAINKFFDTGDKITVDITTSRSGDVAAPHPYLYTKGIFQGDFRFKLDNTFVTKLVAKWPDDTARETGIVLDQRKAEDYKLADRLEAISENTNIMPTKEPVPLTFQHKQSRFTFRMAGQNANGLNIQSIILELQYDQNYGTDKGAAKVQGAFWAYCPGGETAELILVPGTEIKGNTDGLPIVDDKRYMIGQATVGNASTQYTGGIWLDKEVAVTLKAGVDYLVTLTPEGYNLKASIEIHGFEQTEGFVGIPIQMPTANGTAGTYEIGNAIQLVTLSRLLKSGYIAHQEADTWKGYQYIIKNSCTMTANAKLYYLPIDAALKERFKGESSQSVTMIKDTDGKDFSLFAE